MALIVQKYGGTSVGTIERIEAVAGKVAAARQRGDDEERRPGKGGSGAHIPHSAAP
jgi:hypothetical protein